MFVASKLKEENIAEYLIYMWQVEDLLRANHCKMEEIEANIINKYLEDVRPKIEEWYENLLNMMREEGVVEKGHLQINKNVIQQLFELHCALLGTTKYPFYNAAYFKALPFIVELRAKSGNKEENEIETCFEAMYGTLMLKLTHKEISEDTQKAISAIANFLSLLANYYDKEKKGELEWEK